MGSPLEVLFVLDPLRALNPLADSTHVMITEALRRGHRPFGARIEDLGLRGGRAWARASALGLEAGEPGRIVATASPDARELTSFGVVLMRKDPPVDEHYITATWILDRASAEVPVFNEPRGLRDLNEKLSMLEFEDLIPRTHLTRSVDELRELLRELGGQMIVKPVDGFGGRDVFLAREGDPNLGAILEHATGEGARWTIAQEYLEGARDGDKRVLLVDGEPIGAVLRVPAKGELRNNFHTGGSPAQTELDERDRAICSRVGPYLKRRGQFFAGIDVIAGLLTEINVTSPTGMQEVNRLSGLSGEKTMQALFWAALESRLGLGR